MLKMVPPINRNGLLLTVPVLVLIAGIAILLNLHVKVLDTGRFVRQYSGELSPLNTGICRCTPDRELRLTRQDGLTIAGSVYGNDEGEKRPGIILLHGNTPLGRKLPFYGVLAQELESKGNLVLSIDFSGFGESDDPFSLGTLEALNEDEDVYAALEYIRSIPSVDPANIYLVGHSRGSGAALSVATRSEDVKGIALIGPPRRSSERELNADDNQSS